MRRQAEEERARYSEQVRFMEIEIQPLHRVLQGADRNASESQNEARESTAELAPAQAQTVGTVPRVATPPPAHAGHHRQSQNASSSRQVNIRPPMNPEGGYQR